MASNGVYGTKIASNITSDDVEIFYAFSPTRNSDDVNTQHFIKMDSRYLTDAMTSDNDVLEGIKNLRLPLGQFNQKGFYQVLIRPKEVHAIISNVSTLTAYQDVRGIILDSTKVEGLSGALDVNNGLVGYRIVPDLAPRAKIVQSLSPPRMKTAIWPIRPSYRDTLMLIMRL